METAGFALGFDRLALAGGFEAQAEPVRAHVAAIGKGTDLAAARIAADLRAAGIACTLDVQGRKPAKNLDHANERGIPFVVLIGPRELEAGVATVKELASGEQEQVALAGLAARIGRA